jgi:hypothetical protein
MNNEMGIMWKQSRDNLRCYPGTCLETEEKQERPQPGELVSHPRFKPGISQIQG